ncbi:MAG: hypothetical protein E6Q27_00965 [Aeromicrobium sp.]|nr:MAG: hypothetical protein E6Q27_00965 [Aeromicrobium sp.]
MPARSAVVNILRPLGVLATSSFLALAAFHPSYAEPALVDPPEAGIEAVTEPVSGTEAIDLLGSDLRHVAKDNDLSTAELSTMLRQDDGLAVLPHGRLVAQRPATPVQSLGSAVNWDWNVPDGDAFNLSSKPGAAKTIYLDFDGWAGSTSNAWVKYFDAPTLVSGFNREGGASFSSNELREIKWIWAQVAEDFSPFDVNVTTKTPSNFRQTMERANAADKVFGSHVVVSSQAGLSEDLCSGACAGIAIIGSFTHYAGAKMGSFVDTTAGYDYQPAWVFTEWTGGSAAYTADTVSHEAGHNLGLLHSTEKSNPHGYYAGHNNWSPIMGSSNQGTHRPLSQWSNGSFPNALQKQDQIATILKNGFGYRTDEAGADIANAKKVREGVVTAWNDGDTVLLGQCSSATNVTVETATMANLGLRAQLLDPSGNVVSTVSGVDTSSVSTGLSGIGFPSFDRKPGNTNAIFTVPAGTPYYLRIYGASSAPNGYTAYGSVGQWRLTSPCDSGSGVTAGAPSQVVAAPLNQSMKLSWQYPTTGRIQDVTGWRVLDNSNNVVATLPLATMSHTVTGLTNGTEYTYKVQALSGATASVASSASTTPRTVPSAARITKAASGKKGGSVTAKVWWSGSALDNGAPVTRYVVFAYRYKGSKVVQVRNSPWLPASSRYYEMKLPKKGTYRFVVKSSNAAGLSPMSNISGKVKGR